VELQVSNCVGSLTERDAKQESQQRVPMAVVSAPDAEALQSTVSVNETIPAFASRPSCSELIARGENLRKKCLRSSHAIWKPPLNRPDPVQMVEQGDQGRIPQLIPIRHGRMLQSPFTYFRGAALAMAVDLANLPTTGARVQACGATLARAHARSGEPALIAGYLGESDVFDEAIADFSIAYADQSEQDHEALTKAARAGKLEVLIERE
jgi:hypothetical protein